MSSHTSCDHELARDEVFLGNTDDGIADYLRGLKTIRLGIQAYDIHGAKLPGNYRPLIINRAEFSAYDKIMEARVSESRRWRPPTRQSSIPAATAKSVESMEHEDLFQK